MKDINENMTLDDAIQHCHEVAGSCENKGCALNHEQLANWLEELKWFKSITPNETYKIYKDLKKEDNPIEVHLLTDLQIAAIQKDAYKDGYDSGYDSCIENEFD